ncbi:hypothetical protein I7I50_05223 [Histoplasma capsulatum G186AR]|uniref:Uncharacterized protein n=1 Tax=Ajellomyces capsulatus TaxID=5037 RepID=A0A8H8D9V8_AJECA|nr:hypothetical protein I7I52_03481 [Histoplasma capsulatum]QSS75927.1 hypothetical protein I7I50_05223 [Histoplasma capsulatum G186AR]
MSALLPEGHNSQQILRNPQLPQLLFWLAGAPGPFTTRSTYTFLPLFYKREISYQHQQDQLSNKPTLLQFTQHDTKTKTGPLPHPFRLN